MCVGLCVCLTFPVPPTSLITWASPEMSVGFAPHTCSLYGRPSPPSPYTCMSHVAVVFWSQDHIYLHKMFVIFSRNSTLSSLTQVNDSKMGNRFFFYSMTTYPLSIKLPTTPSLSAFQRVFRLGTAPYSPKIYPSFSLISPPEIPISYYTS